MRLSFVTPIIAGVLVSALPIAGATTTKAISVEASADAVQFQSLEPSTVIQENAVQRLPISSPGRPL